MLKRNVNFIPHSKGFRDIHQNWSLVSLEALSLKSNPWLNPHRCSMKFQDLHHLVDHKFTHCKLQSNYIQE